MTTTTLESPRAPQTPTPEQERSARRKVVGGVLSLLGGCLVLQFSFLYIASSDPSAVAESNYYAKAVRWDERQRQEAHNRELGWTGVLELSPQEGGYRTLRLVLTDASGAPLEGCQRIAGQVFHKARAASPYEAQLRPTAPGVYEVRLPLRRPGVWEARLEVQRGDELYTLRRDVLAPGS